MTTRFTREFVFGVLDHVMDPEVPVLSLVELGVVRDVEISGDDVTVVMTPTYSGCPAMKVMEDDVLAALAARGVTRAKLRTVYAPAWTTEWMSDAAREKLRAYGIAPPGRSTRGPEERLVSIKRSRPPVRCPFCGSDNTERTSEFGSTACKALHVCKACTQPFEEFKTI